MSHIVRFIAAMVVAHSNLRPECNEATSGPTRGMLGRTRPRAGNGARGVVLSLLILVVFASAGFGADQAPFGPRLYGAVGHPRHYQAHFVVNPRGSDYVLRVRNNGITLAAVAVNARIVLRPTDFGGVLWTPAGIGWVQAWSGIVRSHRASAHGAAVPMIEKRVRLRNGRNDIDIGLIGPVGRSIVVEIVEANATDTTPPEVTMTVSPTPNDAGWNNTPVEVRFTCTDSESGVAVCPAPISVRTEGANQVVSGVGVDQAGNQATARATVHVDRTPPTISVALHPPLPPDGVFRMPVTARFTCADGLSGVLLCPMDITFTETGTDMSASGTSIDGAGNTAATTSPVFSIAPPSSPDTPASLVSMLASADTATAKADAIRRIWEFLGLPVYRGDIDEAVGPSANRELFYFELESRIIAQSLLDGKEFQLREIATILNRGLHVPSGHEIQPAILLKGLSDAALDAIANPDDRTLFVPRLIRELGLYTETPYDLLQQPPLDAVRLNLLQVSLLLADITRGDQSPRQSELAAGADVIEVGTTIAAVCEALRDFVGPEVREQAKWVLKFLPATFTGSPWVILAIELVHSVILQAAISVEPLQSISGHWSHESEVVIPISVVVRMKSRISPVLEECAWLFGVTFPEPNDKGVIPGVKVDFVDGLLIPGDPIAAEGVLECVNQCITDDDGLATILLTTFREPQPAVGELVESTGYLVANPKVFVSNSNLIIGKLDEVFRTAGGNIRWSITRHQPVAGKWSGRRRVLDSGRHFSYLQEAFTGETTTREIWQTVEATVDFRINQDYVGFGMSAGYGLDVTGTFTITRIENSTRVSRDGVCRTMYVETWTGNEVNKASSPGKSSGAISLDVNGPNTYQIEVYPYLVIFGAGRATETTCNGDVYTMDLGPFGYPVLVDDITGVYDEGLKISGDRPLWASPPALNILIERHVGWSFAYGRYPDRLPEPTGHPTLPEELPH